MPDFMEQTLAKTLLEMCYFLVHVFYNLEAAVKLKFSQMLFQSNWCFLGVNLV